MLAQGFCTMAGRDGGGRYYRCTTGVAFATTEILPGSNKISFGTPKYEYHRVQRSRKSGRCNTQANAVYVLFCWLIQILSCESPLTESLLT